MAETFGADRTGVRPLSCVNAKVCFQILHAVELPVADCAAEGAAARRVKLQPSLFASCDGRLTALLEAVLALAVMPPQQAGQLEGLTAELTGVDVGKSVTQTAARPGLTCTDPRRGL